MIFKPDKIIYRQIVIVVGGTTIISMIRLSDGADWRAIVLAWSTMIIIMTRYWIAIGRTFIMNEIGCVVILGGYRREYKWEEFKIKAIEDFSHARMTKSTYKKGVIFSVRNIHKPWWWEPTQYSWHLHPLSFVFVNFTPKGRFPGVEKIYEVDEDVFLRQMQEWNVELEEISFYK